MASQKNTVWQRLETVSWIYSGICNTILGPATYWLNNPALPTDPAMHRSRFNSLGFLIMHMGMIQWYSAFYSKDHTLKALVASCIVGGDVLLLADRARLFLQGELTDSKELMTTFVFAGIETLGMLYATIRNVKAALNDQATPTKSRSE